MSVLESAARAASSTGGQVLRAATRVATARPAAKPLHPRGSVVDGTLRRFDGGEKSGAAWLDESGSDRVLVRHSRAVGVWSRLPDIFGLAVRVPTQDGRYGDLLFATTGLGRLTRFTLTPARSPYSRPMTTLLPYRTPAGPVLLSAVFAEETTVALGWAAGSGAWHRFGELLLHEPPAEETDRPVSFEPVRNVLPGLETYEWVRRLRDPSYITAEKSRGSESSLGEPDQRSRPR